MRKRHVGVAKPVKKGDSTVGGYQKKAQELQATSLQSAMDTIKLLEEKLTLFAQKHKNEIQKDPAFRAQFLQLCAPLGVDPLVSDKASSGLWGKLGLGLDEFYAALSVRVAEVCIATRSSNGGIISVRDIQTKLERRGTKFNLGGQQRIKVSEEDIVTAISKLSALGSGFRTLKLGNNTMIVSVPTELDSDHTEVIRLALNFQGVVTLKQIQTETKWDQPRCQRALDLLLTEGMAWLDVHKSENYFWFPSVWRQGI